MQTTLNILLCISYYLFETHVLHNLKTMKKSPITKYSDNLEGKKRKKKKEKETS